MSVRYVFSVLFLLNLFNYIDRQVLYAVFPLIQTDLHLTDGQLGLLASVFMLVYMCYAPLMGVLADRFSRPRLMGLSALLWSAATLASASAKNFAHLIMARGMIGVGEGGFTTMAQPFLAEHYPPEKHALKLALFGLALPLGSALGYMLGGLLGHTWGWRIALMVLSIPGMFLALCVSFLPDPGRQRRTPPPGWLQYRTLFTHKPFLYVCLVQTVITFMMGGFSAWVPTYLFRYLNLNIAQAGVYFGGLVILCGTLGTYAGGKLTDAWLKKSSHAYARVMKLALLGCLLPIGLGLCATQLTTVLFCFGLAITFLFLPTGAIAAALVASTPANVRATAFAINIFMIHLLGDALSPVLIGGLSTTWGLRAAFWICTAVIMPGLWCCNRLLRHNVSLEN